MRLNELNVKLTIPAIPSEHIEDETPESMCILRRGKDSRWWTLGGTKGTVLLADVEKGQCFTLTSFNENKPIAEIWWKDNEVVLLNRAGKVRRGTVLIEYAEEFFQDIPVD